MSISKTIKTKPLDVQKIDITYSHVMEALGWEGEWEGHSFDYKIQKTWLHVGTTICLSYL